MQRIGLVFTWALWLSWLGTAPQLSAQDNYTPQAPLAKLELQDGDSIVFLGDSITHQCLYTQYVEDYFYTRYPHMRLKLHNAGVGGARAWDALQRFDDDVAAYKPKYVTILLGMNDGTYRPYDDPTYQTYQSDMTTLLDQLDGIGAKPIPMTPTMFDARAARLFPRGNRPPESIALYNSVLTYYGTWLREVAAERGYGFVDMWGPLNNITFEQRKIDPAFTMIKDAVHPEADGQLVMATAIINDLGLSRQVSAIRISKGANGWMGKGTGGELSEVTATDSGISFTFHATALPWVVPEAAQRGVELTKLGHRLSKETVEIHGLPAGRYTLLIDGDEVGTYGHEALARHIELQGNNKTPQYQQALAVAHLNEQRNSGPVRSLRGEWGRFQGFARERRNAEQNPDHADLQEKFKKLAAGIEGIADRVAQHNAAAKEIEDQIFTKNQPQVHRYELRRVQPAAK
ncbi:MAG: SGNH/GDSL hydrolase family protein [Planctomycetaceae bacterium]|nr:SGNH/GDSL hydrolase family protein [Planctomycetaceae bacterium]